MPSADEIIATILKHQRPKPKNENLLPGQSLPPPPVPLPADQLAAHLRGLAASPPKDVVAALARLEGEVIEKVTEYNQLELLAKLFVAHTDAVSRLAFAKCLALNGAPKPAGAEQPGAGAAAATVLTSDANLVAGLKVEKGGFPQVLVDGIYWSGVWVSRGKYGDPPPAYDFEPLRAWSAAVGFAGNSGLRTACVRASSAVIGRFVPVARKAAGPPPKDDPFGLRQAASENEKIKAAKRAALEGALEMIASDEQVVDDLRAQGKGEVQKLFKAALELEDEPSQELLSRIIAAHCPCAPFGQDRAASLREACGEARAARLGFLAGALDRAFGEWKADAKKKSHTYAKMAMASLAKKAGGAMLLAALTKSGETNDPVMAALEKRWLEKAEAGGSSASLAKPAAAAPASKPQEKKSGLLSLYGGSSGASASGKSGVFAKPAAAAVTPPPRPAEPGDLVSRSAVADLFRPREGKEDGAMATIGDKGFAEALGPKAVEGWKAAFAKSFETAAAAAVV